jgi:hypothetical protein
VPERAAAVNRPNTSPTLDNTLPRRRLGVTTALAAGDNDAFMKVQHHISAQDHGPHVIDA